MNIPTSSYLIYLKNEIKNNSIIYAKMKIVGVTGGIGSGKSTVCKVFETLGIPVFNADDEAKSIYDTEPLALQQVKETFGDSVFTSGSLDKVKLAKIVFSDKEKLEQLNAIIHPLVRKRFATWQDQQSSPYVIREAAILIESGAHKDCDHIILVSAEEETRIKRVTSRNNISEEEVRKRIANQWTDEQRRPFCDFEIKNEENSLVLKELYKIHLSLL